MLSPIRVRVTKGGTIKLNPIRVRGTVMLNPIRVRVREEPSSSTRLGFGLERNRHAEPD